MITGLLPLSADPIHLGHLDIIGQAADQCDRLVVLICNNGQKAGSYLFSLEERCLIAQRAIEHHLPRQTHIEVKTDDGVLADAYLREGCAVLFRGIRNREDEAFERQQIRYHELILPQIGKIVTFLQSRPEFSHLSSSVVKGFVEHGLDVSEMVPLFVKSKLERRLLGRVIIGVAGPMAAGKSRVAKALVNRLGVKHRQDPSFPQAHHVDMDALIRGLYVENTPGAQVLREQVADVLGAEFLSEDRTELRADVLKERIADGNLHEEDLKWLHNCFEPHVFRVLREHLRGKKGFVFLEWALLIENGMRCLVNNDVLLVSSPDRAGFLLDRGVPAALSEKFQAQHDPVADKVTQLRQAIQAEDCGLVIQYENRRGIEDCPVWIWMKGQTDPWTGEPTMKSLADILLQLFPEFRIS